MLNICSLFQKFFGFIKNIRKTTYRKCMVIVSGIVLISVICLASKNFGGSGKNSVSANLKKGEIEADTDTNDTDANAIIQDLLFSYGNTSEEESSNIKGFYDCISEILNDSENVLMENKKYASIKPLETDKLSLSNMMAELQKNNEKNKTDINTEASVNDTMAEQTTEPQTTEQQTTQEQITEQQTEQEQTTQAQETQAQEQSIIEETAMNEPKTEEVVEETAAVYSSVYCDVSESDYYWLTKIVEAEAGDQDDIGKMLVVNVIINRVNSDRFPNTIKSVIFQNNGRTYQFEPVKNERIYDMNPTNSTISCVDRALNGEDYSNGALFFTMKTSSSSWFNSSLTLLFVHGDHYFYTY